MTRTLALSARETRRIALAAQGLADPRPERAADARAVRRVFDRVGLIQIDSVNVVARSHYLPPFARLGAYDPALLDGLAYGRGRRLFEYWGHEASLIPVELQPLFRWRMARAWEGAGIYGGLAKFGSEKRAFVEAVLKEVERRGPLSAGELESGGKAQGGWWGWSDGKRALEFLFWAGRVTTASRRGFERLYDLTERAMPPAVAVAPTPAIEDAQRELVRSAARAMGVATEGDLRDYFRLSPGESKARVAELVEAGELLPVEVEGWGRQAYLWPQARTPRRARASALLSPFDSLVWRRERAERLFGFRYRLEIYTPAHLRTYGYYVLPYLLGDRIAARLDVKADRQARTLRVHALHLEPGVAPDEIAEPLGAELRLMAGWLGLASVAVAGDDAGAEAVRRYA